LCWIFLFGSFPFGGFRGVFRGAFERRSLISDASVRRQFPNYEVGNTTGNTIGTNNNQQQPITTTMIATLSTTTTSTTTPVVVSLRKGLHERRRQSERTASQPHGLSFSHYKSVHQDKHLTRMDVCMRSSKEHKWMVFLVVL
jgi:hypothetical protein